MRFSQFILNTLLLLATSSAFAADHVTPSDRVETHVRIRAAPNANSAIVGFLNIGELRPLRTSIPNWYEIALPTGAAGFVSKAWTQRVPETLSALTSAELRLGAWNVRKLGHGTQKNFSLLTQAIESNFDILAVVEVMQKAGGRPGYDELMSNLGSEWSGMVTANPRPNTPSGSAEFYAIVYRINRVRPCNGWPSLRVHTDSDGSNDGSGPDIFSREPAFGCFIAIRSDGTGGTDFLLAAYHARWADGDITDIQSEVAHLSAVFASMSQAASGERDLFIAGDFNLRPTDLAAVVSQLDATAGSGSTLNSAGDLTSNLYDHLVVFDAAAASELVQQATVLDLRELASSNAEFFRTVSDHLPIVTRLRVLQDDD